MRVLTTKENIRSLVNQGLSVVLLYGNANYLCNWVGGEMVSDALGIHSFDEAGYADIQMRDHVVRGHVKQSRNFAFGRIFESGHMVPFYQPALALEILRRIINAKDIATRTEELDNYITNGPLTSTYKEGLGII